LLYLLKHELFSFTVFPWFEDTGSIPPRISKLGFQRLGIEKETVTVSNKTLAFRFKSSVARKRSMAIMKKLETWFLWKSLMPLTTEVLISVSQLENDNQLHKKHHKHSSPFLFLKNSCGKESIWIKVVFLLIWPSDVAWLANSDLDES
jgi:hypothetical protein